MFFTIKARISLATLVLSAALAIPVLATATPVSGDLFSTRFDGAPRVSKVSFNFDGSVFTLGSSTGIGNTSGADGIVGDPRNSDLLIVGGQGGNINTISKSTGTATSVASPVSIFRLEVANSTTVYGSGIPGGLARHTINPDGSIGVGTAISLSGSDTGITQLITTPSGFFYTSSGSAGFGNFGTLTFSSATATTSRLYGAADRSAVRLWRPRTAAFTTRLRTTSS